MECPDLYALNYSEFVMRVVVHLNNVEFGFCCRSPLITRHP
jgi:hypothetical protein